MSSIVICESYPIVRHRKPRRLSTKRLFGHHQRTDAAAYWLRLGLTGVGVVALSIASCGRAEDRVEREDQVPQEPTATKVNHASERNGLTEAVARQLASAQPDSALEQVILRQVVSPGARMARPQCVTHSIRFMVPDPEHRDEFARALAELDVTLFLGPEENREFRPADTCPTSPVALECVHDWAVSERDQAASPTLRAATYIKRLVFYEDDAMDDAIDELRMIREREERRGATCREF